MARLVATFDGMNHHRQPRVVRVRYYADLDEYICEVTDGGKRRDAIDYYTSDKADALATGAAMARP